jgi:hypothetical protein
VQDDNSLLGKVLSFWFDRLKAANGPNSSFYENVGVNRRRIINSVVSPGGNPTLLMDLLIGTTQVVGAATSARTSIRNFLATATLEPSRAIQSLARFGDQLVTAFGNISKVYGGQALSPLGTLAFTETARVLSGNAGTVTAMLDVAVLTLDVKPDQLPDSGPSPSQVLAGNRLLAVSVPAQLPFIPAALRSSQ